ncbi:heme exporter protein CcmD [Ahrensia marina]|uniref:heme exporter protein CcmD n=1 Tax=Ahrensia marina TaxID=1514904 RepID=UPI0009EBFFCF|nr:heme exporter protein CcmD [Ahrensia marina]
MSEHEIFVYASYGLGALILTALVLWLWIDRNMTVKELARLEEMGVRRRSQTQDEQA